MSAYDERLTQLAEDLINTFDLYLASPEHLREPADLARFLQQRGFMVERELGTSNLASVRDFREQLRAAWTADTVEAAIERLNPLLVEPLVSLQLDASGDVGLRFNAPVDTDLVDRLKLDAALGVVFALQKHGIERMRACDAAPCQDVFIDTSRNRSRRFCSENCANRYNIAMYRQRQRDNE